MFKEYLTGEFAGTFETVIFPIPAGRRSNKNHDTFKEVFDEKSKTLDEKLIEVFINFLIEKVNK